MAATESIDRVRQLMRRIGAEKAAMEDPGSSHPTDVPEADGNEQGEQTGSFASENEKKVKEQVPNAVDEKSDVTPGSAPKANEGRVDEAKVTGDAPAVEDDYKDRPDKPQKTTHPADADVGEKYSSWNLNDLGSMTTEQLYKLSAELANDCAADVANDVFMPKAAAAKPATKPANKPATKPGEKQASRTTTYCNECHDTYEGESCPSCATKAAAAKGMQDAASVGDQTCSKVAKDLAAQTYKTAINRADRVYAHLVGVKKAEEEAEETSDPTGGSAEGEDHTEKPKPGEGSGSSAPPATDGQPSEGGGGGSDILAAMSGSGGGDAAGGGAMGGGPPMGGAMGGGAPGAPPGGMDQQQLLQALVMALQELGMGGGQQLAGMGPPPGAPPGAPAPGPEIAKMASEFIRSGKYQFKVATGRERGAVDYFKGYITELVSRSK